GLPVQITGSLAASVSTSCVGGNYSAAILFSNGDGNKNIVASQTDATGNTGSANRTFVRDTVAPVISINSPAANSYVSSTAVISGTCESGLQVRIAGDGVSTAVNAACVGNNYSGSIFFTADDGVKTVTASQTDNAGNSA